MRGTVSEGVDYSTNHPDPRLLYEAGRTFAGRYVGLGSSGKHLTVDEASSLTKAGVAVIALCEGTTSWMLNGYEAGRYAATKALAHAQSCGMPEGRPIYFSHDIAPRSIDWPAIKRTLAGAAMVLGPSRVGLYGGTSVLQWARRDGVAAWFWQALGWRDGVWLDWVHVQQYQNNVARFGSGSLDLDRGLKDDIGAWMTGESGMMTDVNDLYADQRIEAMAYRQPKFSGQGGFAALPTAGAEVPFTTWTVALSNAVAKINADVTALNEAISALAGKMDALTETIPFNAEDRAALDWLRAAVEALKHWLATP